MKNGVLVLNAGSSSLKFAVFEYQGNEDELNIALRGEISSIGSSPVFKSWKLKNSCKEHSESVEMEESTTHLEAIDVVLRWVTENAGNLSLSGVGHRVVHGGVNRSKPALVTNDLLEELQALSVLAPHHQPHNLAAIKAVASAVPDLPQVACFDTAFHAEQPEVARRLPLPASYRNRGLLRYGFHGLSYEYICGVVSEYNNDQMPGKLIVAHLGNGASLCAINDGRSVATTMGFSTLDGLMMGTRCGSIDPGVLIHLLREEKMDEGSLTDLLYNRSGLLGVSGISSDMRVLIDSEEPAAAEAIELFCYSLMRAMGSMLTALQGVDAIVFTGGIGEKSKLVRANVCQQLSWLGLKFDHAANLRNFSEISSKESKVKVWVIPADEEKIIGRHTMQTVRG